MPLSKYYKGHGEKVMAEMKKRYGKRGESVFYATAKKRRMSPKKHSKRRDQLRKMLKK